MDYGERARRSFQNFVGLRPEVMALIEESYNRLFRGLRHTGVRVEALNIARWRGRIVLKPHQRAGAQRLVANNGGLLGFDVGVGKTYTGIATIAALREIGRAKRPGDRGAQYHHLEVAQRDPRRTPGLSHLDQ